MPPSSTQLQGMVQKSEESFKEYAQRWRELAARVQPPLLDRELTYLFVGTLQDPYLQHILGSISTSFSNLVTIGECIEDGLKSGKIQGTSSAINGSNKKPCFGLLKKKEGETSATINKGKASVHHQDQAIHRQTSFVHPNVPRACATISAQQPRVTQHKSIHHQH